MKILVFGPIIIFFAVFGLLIAGFLGLVAKLVIGAKNSAWEGEVIDKKYVEKREDHKIEHFYSLRVKTTEGKEMGVGVGRLLYDQFEIGDKIRKSKGKLIPEKC